MPHLLAVDGNSLAHRAWHALREEGMGGAWVTHGVIRMLATAWDHGPFDSIVFAFDSRESIRRDLEPAYKGNRDEHDPDLYDQLDRFANLVEACGFTVALADGYEADDLLAATVAACREAAVHCTVLSSDRDLISLVCDTVTLLRPRGSMHDVEVCDPAGVLDAYDVEPHKYLQLAALRGDPSDGLKGATGVGAKTAARLLRSWDTVAEIYANLHNVSPDLADKLRASRERVERNLELMSPMGEHEIDVVGTVGRGIDIERMVDVLTRARLWGAAGSLRIAIERGPLPPPPPPPDEDTTDHWWLEGEEMTLQVDPIHLEGEQTALF